LAKSEDCEAKVTVAEKVGASALDGLEASVFLAMITRWWRTRLPAGSARFLDECSARRYLICLAR
jgi:hypothetical protein